MACRGWVALVYVPGEGTAANVARSTRTRNSLLDDVQCARRRHAAIFPGMPGDADIPPNVQELIRRHLPSLDHAELLLSLSGASGPLTLSDLADRRGLDALSAMRIVAHLGEAGLAEYDVGTGRVTFNPESHWLRTAVEKLATVYDERPLALVRAIQNRPRDAILSFADAFRIRRNP